MLTYQIKVQGNVDPSWAEWFSGLEVAAQPAGEASWVTTFLGPVSDQASLRGILNHLWDLNLTILSVVCMDEPGLIRTSGAEDYEK